MPDTPPPTSLGSPAENEETFLETYDPSVFERPSVAVDVVALTTSGGALHAVVLRRRNYPFKARWALPGNFVRMDESLDAAAARILHEKAGLDDVFLEQLYTFGDPTRDPRTRVIAVTYYALVDRARLESALPEGGVLARIHVPWAGETGGPVELFDTSGAEHSMGFDHEDIIGMAVKRIRGKLGYTPIGFQLLPTSFTLRQLQEVHETVLGRPLNKDSFRRRMLASGLLEATGDRERGVGHRPAELYRILRRSAI